MLGAEAVPHLAAMLPGLPQLTWLNLSNNALGPAAAALWAAVGESQIEKVRYFLFFERQRCRPRTFIDVTPSHPPFVCQLDLSRCGLTNEGCQSMAAGLASSKLTVRRPGLLGRSPRLALAALLSQRADPCATDADAGGVWTDIRGSAADPCGCQRGRLAANPWPGQQQVVPCMQTFEGEGGATHATWFLIRRRPSELVLATKLRAALQKQRPRI